MARPPGTTLSRKLEDDTTLNGETEMTTATATKPTDNKAKGIDFAALAASVSDSTETIEREGGAGRPKQDNPFAPRVAESRKDGKVKELPVSNQEVAEKATAMLRRAASDAGHGLTTKIVRRGNRLVVLFQAKDKKAIGEKQECPVCQSKVTVTSEGTLRVHGAQDNRCKGSGTKVA